MNKNIERILISKDEICKMTERLGRSISNDYKDKELIIIGILKGGFVFMADLIRQIDLDCKMDFLAVSSYGVSTKSTGAVKITKDIELDINGKDILIVEDIIDTGLTLTYIRELLKGRGARSIKIAAAFDKPSRRKTDIEAEYLGFEVPDEFIVGYGLDYAGKYRNLPDACLFKQ